jgi:general secretion pathway protein K
MSKTAGIRKTASENDGFIVVAVLWILSLLGVLASIYMLYVVDTATAVSTHDDRVRMEGLVSAALELTAYRLKSVDLPTRTSGHFEFRLGKARISARYRSEAARIDINAAPKQFLARLFGVLGSPPEIASGFADRIIAWREAKADALSAESFAYKAAGLKYGPRGAKFPNLNELSLGLDLPPEAIQRALPFLTVYNGRPQVNVLEAAPEVLAALPGITPERLNELLSQRNAPDGEQKLMQLLGAAQAYATTHGSKASRVQVDVELEDGHHAASEAVILLLDQGSAPYAILTWSDAFAARSTVLK